MDSAHTVVVATAQQVQARAARPDEADGVPVVTDVQLTVHSILKGSAGTNLLLTVPGGTLGSLSLTNPDAPSFTEGGTYVVFLDAERDVVAWRQGQPRVVGDQVPALDRSLSQLKTRAERLTGTRIRELSPVPAAPAGGVLLRRAASSTTATRDGDTASDEAATRDGVATRALPTITSITPSTGSAGTNTLVTLTGSGFGSSPGKVGGVGFFYDPSSAYCIGAPIVSWSSSSIRCRVPTGLIEGYPASAASGPVCVWTSTGARSNDVQFSVTFGYGGIQWPQPPVHYRINPAGAGISSGIVGTLAQKAATTWNDAAPILSPPGTTFSFTYDGPCSTTTLNVRDGRNDLFWGPISDDTTIAEAWTRSVGRAILETDIKFNTSLPKSGGGTYTWDDGTGDTLDTQGIALHELGHWLNLRDLYGDADADKVMYGYGGAGEAVKVLSDGDRAGIQWVYSAARVDTAKPTAAARAVRARRTAKIRLPFKVSDPAYSCGAAYVRVVVRNSRGRVVARTRTWTGPVPVGKWLRTSGLRIRKAGRYRYFVYAKDLLGHTQRKVGAARVIVR